MILFSLLFILAVFQLSPSTGESFFWVTSVCMYLWPCIILLAAIPLLGTRLRSVKIILVLSFLFVGGGSEVVALESLAILLVLLTFQSRHPFPAIKFSRKNLWMAAMALFVALVIAGLGHGRSVRQEALPGITGGEWFWLAIQSAGYYLLIQVPVKVHWFFFMALPWIVLRRIVEPQASQTVPVVFRNLSKYFLGFICVVLFHFLLVTFLLHSFPPARTSITLTLGLAALCAISGWQLGALSWPPAAIRAIPFLFAMACGILLIHGIATQSGKAKAYAHGWDERMDMLRSHAAADSTFLLQPLPPAGMLYSAEISEDSTHFSNRQLRDYLELKRAPIRWGE